MVGLSLAPAGSAEVIFRRDPLPAADPSMGIPVGRLEAGELRRTLVDLSEVLPEHLDPGEYDVSISFGPAAIRAESGPLRLAFRRPSLREAEILTRLGPEQVASGSWGQWTRLPPVSDPNILPWGPDDPLRLNWILRELFHGAARLATIPLARLDVLDGLFEPEREALRAEILAAGNDRAALARQVADVKRRFPELTYWMNAILAGESEIAWTRKMRGE
jgi:hypothetical protein